MPNPSAPADEVDVPSPSSSRTDRELWAETGVVLVVGVFVPLACALMSLRWPEGWQYPSFTASSLPLMVQLLGMVTPALYLIARAQEPWSAFGFTGIKWWRDSFTVAGLLFLDYFFYYHCYLALSWLIGPGFHDAMKSLGTVSYPAPSGGGEYALAALVSFGAGFTEEIILRGYLLPRFERLLGSTAQALVLTAVLFASYHVYQDLNGVLSCLISGLVYGGCFCWLRRVWPLVAAHTIHDLLAYWQMTR